jgi:hypothetical protein
MSVEWQESARDELADIWVEATPDERELIASIIERLERELRKDWQYSRRDTTAAGCFLRCFRGWWPGPYYPCSPTTSPFQVIVSHFVDRSCVSDRRFLS